MAATAERGFAGSVTAHSAADVLQFNGANRFSGSIVVSHRGHRATIFMQHGEVVHAECGDLKGEAAIGAVMAWPTGNFEAHANVATFHRTIEKRLDHLLLDAARFIDEARRDESPPPPEMPPRPGPVVQAMGVPGVSYAALLRGGVTVSDPSPSAAELAARTTYLLAMLANPISKALGLGGVVRAALTTESNGQLLLLHGNESDLALAIEADAPLEETEAAVRRSLGAKHGA